MKMVVGSLALCFGVLSSNASAEVLLMVDGNEYTLSGLMENCQSMGDNPAAQVACFNAVSDLLKQQTGEAETPTAQNAADALEALRAVAQYDDTETGLIIQGTDCNAEFLYYANYFHVSRRNVSTIDMFHAQLDMSQVDLEQTVQQSGSAANLAKGAMRSGANAATFGGEAISSAEYGVAPKSPQMTIGQYASSLADQLMTNESSAFDFVLVHPAKQQENAEIWDAFQAYGEACQS